MRKLLLSLAVLGGIAASMDAPAIAMPIGQPALAAILDQGAAVQTVQYGGVSPREYRRQQEFRRRQAIRRHEFRRRQAARRGYYSR